MPNDDKSGNGRFAGYRFWITTLIAALVLTFMIVSGLVGSRLSERSFAAQQKEITVQVQVHDARIATLEESVRGMKESIGRIEKGVGDINTYLLNNQLPSAPDRGRK